MIPDITKHHRNFVIKYRSNRVGLWHAEVSIKSKVFFSVDGYLFDIVHNSCKKWIDDTLKENRRFVRDYNKSVKEKRMSAVQEWLNGR
jgi:hypothetical protein